MTGTTALHLAANKGHVNVLNTLLLSGADPFLLDLVCLVIRLFFFTHFPSDHDRMTGFHWQSQSSRKTISVLSFWFASLPILRLDLIFFPLEILSRSKELVDLLRNSAIH
jgi:ankyrin repeat protein